MQYETYTIISARFSIPDIAQAPEDFCIEV